MHEIIEEQAATAELAHPDNAAIRWEARRALELTQTMEDAP